MKEAGTKNNPSLFDNLIAIQGFLLKSKGLIAAITILPLVIYFLYGSLQKKPYPDSFIATIIKLNTQIEGFNTDAIISESIVAEALAEIAPDLEPATILPHLNIVNGFERKGNPIRESLSKLAVEVSAANADKLSMIQSRYDQTIENQNNYRTIFFNLKNSPLDKESAERLVADIISRFNSQFEKGLILTTPLVSEIDTAFYKSLKELNPQNLSQLNSTLEALEEKNRKLLEMGFSDKGFNPQLIENQLKYLDLQLAGIIGLDEQLKRYFFKDIDKEINIATANIQSLNEALGSISDKKQGLNAVRNNSGNFTQGEGVSQTQLFERFLNVGASLSLIQLQEKIVNQKLALEFKKSELAQLKESYKEPSFSTLEINILYSQLLQDAKEITASLNDYISAYGNEYLKQLVTPVRQMQASSGSPFRLRTMVLILLASFGMAVSIVAVGQAFKSN